MKDNLVNSSEGNQEKGIQKNKLEKSRFEISSKNQMSFSDFMDLPDFNDEQTNGLDSFEIKKDKLMNFCQDKQPKNIQKHNFDKSNFQNFSQKSICFADFNGLPDFDVNETNSSKVKKDQSVNSIQKKQSQKIQKNRFKKTSLEINSKNPLSFAEFLNLPDMDDNITDQHIEQQPNTSDTNCLIDLISKSGSHIIDSKSNITITSLADKYDKKETFREVLFNKEVKTRSTSLNTFPDLPEDLLIDNKYGVSDLSDLSKLFSSIDEITKPTKGKQFTKIPNTNLKPPFRSISTKKLAAPQKSTAQNNSLYYNNNAPIKNNKNSVIDKEIKSNSLNILSDLPDDLLDNNTNVLSMHPHTSNFCSSINKIRKATKDKTSTKNIVENLKVPPKIISTMKKIEKPNATYGSSLSYSDKISDCKDKSLITSKLRTNTEIDNLIENFNFVEVVHNGKHKFNTTSNTMKVVNTFHVPKTIITYKVPKIHKTLDAFYKIIYGPLFTTESLDCKLLVKFF